GRGAAHLPPDGDVPGRDARRHPAGHQRAARPEPDAAVRQPVRPGYRRLLHRLRRDAAPLRARRGDLRAAEALLRRAVAAADAGPPAGADLHEDPVPGAGQLRQADEAVHRPVPPHLPRQLGRVSWIDAERAVIQMGSRKAEEELVAELRATTTTPRGASWAP